MLFYRAKLEKDSRPHRMICEAGQEERLHQSDWLLCEQQQGRYSMFDLRAMFGDKVCEDIHNVKDAVLLLLRDLGFNPAENPYDAIPELRGNPFVESLDKDYDYSEDGMEMQRKNTNGPFMY